MGAQCCSRDDRDELQVAAGNITSWQLQSLSMTGVKCESKCNRSLENVKRCANGGLDSDYHFTGDETRFYDDEVKPAKWALSEYDQWQEETGNLAGVSNIKGVMAEWRDIKETYVTLGTFKNGAYGQCFKGYCRTLGCTRVVRHLKKSDKPKVAIARLEAILLMRMDHPNIAKLAELVEDNMNLYVVMDLHEGGALSTFMQDGFHFTEVPTLVIMHQLISAVRYLHEEIRICHRDIKLDNLVFTTKDPIETSTNVLKLIDFRRYGQMDASGYFYENVTTVYYAAPEVIQEHYTEKCDLWSSGVIMYVLLCGEFPFKGATIGDVRIQVQKGNFVTKDELWSHVSEESKALLRGLLNYKVHHRFSADDASKCEVFSNKVSAGDTGRQWV